MEAMSSRMTPVHDFLMDSSEDLSSPSEPSLDNLEVQESNAEPPIDLCDFLKPDIELVPSFGLRKCSIDCCENGVDTL